MSVQQKILAACFGFIVIIMVLGGLAQQQATEMGRYTIDLYDHSFIGMSYINQAQEEFHRIIAAHRDGDAAWTSRLQKVLDRLDVALERAASEHTRAAGTEVRALLAALPDTPAVSLVERTKQLDNAMNGLAGNFAAEGLVARDEADVLAAYSTRLVLVEIAVAVCLAVMVSLLVGRNLSQPLVELIRTIGRLAAGELEHESAPWLLRRHDEIGEVARATEVFREAMRQNARLSEERERETIEAEKRQAAMRELKRIRLLSDISREILIIFRDGLILQINAAGSRLFGMPDEHLIGRPVLDLILESDRPAVTRRLDSREAFPDHEEIHLCVANGMRVPVEFSCSVIDYEGKAATVLALRDLSDRKRDEARIRHLAHHDALTDLPNRFLLGERLAFALNAAAHSDTILALLYLDLDHFKPVNDLLGHAAGDALLIQVAKRLQAELRSTDTLARIGGDEFVIVATLDGPENAAALADRLVAVLAQPFELGTDQVEIGTSIGIALYPKDGGSQEALMHSADTALYRAKQEKRGTFRFFEPAMDEHVQARQQFERDLRRAVERGQLQLHYQPLVSCATGEVEGFEALLRWHHPEHGLISPQKFIPVAEETGLIVRIGQWALEDACATAARWKQPHWVAVNISPVQFRQHGLLDSITEILARTGLPAYRLEIEITEGILMEDPDRAADVLSALRGLGVRIALDDFGTGYSSLSYLHAFKFDKLKIDKSFITRLGKAEDSTLIVRTIINLARDLGLSIVAEGVETPQQLAIVREFMCDQVQGYLVSRPAPMGESHEPMMARARMLITECINTSTKPDPADNMALALGK